MGWEERRGQAIVDEVFRFSRSALSASAVSLCWSEPDRGARAPEILGMEHGFLADYFQNGMAFDPVCQRRARKEKYTTLSRMAGHVDNSVNTENYLSFIRSYNYEDETNFFLDFEEDRVAVLTVFAKNEMALDPSLLHGLHGLMSNLVMNHPIPQRRRRRRICLNTYNLTSREFEVAELVREGASNNDVRLRLGISLATVKTHISRILDKMAVESRSALAAAVNHF